MKTKFFTNCTTLEELKKEYHKLAMANHPDRGGDVATMQAINAEYEKMFEVLKNTHKTKEGKTYTKTTNEAPTDLINLINQLLKLDGVHIEVIGSFVWLSGNTKAYKDIIKGLGFKWHKTKIMWYKAPTDYRKYTNKNYSIEEVRNMYGVQYEADGKGAKMLEA